MGIVYLTERACVQRQAFRNQDKMVDWESFEVRRPYILSSGQPSASSIPFTRLQLDKSVLHHCLGDSLPRSSSVADLSIRFQDEFHIACGMVLTSCILPFRQRGQQVRSSPVSRRIISVTVSLSWAGKSFFQPISFLMSGMASFLFLLDRKPKYRIFMKPSGRMCSRKRRINSSADRVISLIWSLSALSL